MHYGAQHQAYRQPSSHRERDGYRPARAIVRDSHCLARAIGLLAAVDLNPDRHDRFACAAFHRSGLVTRDAGAGSTPSTPCSACPKVARAMNRNGPPLFQTRGPICRRWLTKPISRRDVGKKLSWAHLLVRDDVSGEFAEQRQMAACTVVHAAVSSSFGTSRTAPCAGAKNCDTAFLPLSFRAASGTSVRSV
jgi:hypothetical protein